MSTDPKRKRRDDDPVRIYSDHRLAYWTGGLPGVGERKQERCGTAEQAANRAVELRKLLGQVRTHGPAPTTTLAVAMQNMLHNMRATKADPSTITQYKSNWNCWMPAEIALEVRCMEAGIRHWTAIFDHVVAGGATETTVENVARTLGALATWGSRRGYFVSSEPFGSSRQRRDVVNDACRRARISAADRNNTYTIEVCPGPADIDRFADAFENEYPGYGRRLVLLGYATGLRINELLALRWDAIDLETGDVKVEAQLGRHQAWPAVKLPKGKRVRTAMVWTGFLDVARSLVEDSLALPADDPHHGWLFPRHRSTTAWADQAGKLARAAKASADWEWTFHWLRHSFATMCLAPEAMEGFGLTLSHLRSLLGHAHTNTTMNMYVDRTVGDQEIARERTARTPGGRTWQK